MFRWVEKNFRYFLLAIFVPTLKIHIVQYFFYILNQHLLYKSLQCQTYQSHGHSASESYTDVIISNVFEARNIFFDNIFAGHNRSEVFDWVVAHILSKVSYYFFFVGGTFDTSTH